MFKQCPAPQGASLTPSGGGKDVEDDNNANGDGYEDTLLTFIDIQTDSFQLIKTRMALTPDA